jgi:hypothetical protein
MLGKILGKNTFDGNENDGKNEYEDRRRRARLAGLMYLSVIIFGISAQVTRMSLVDPEDAMATVGNIEASMTAFRLSLVSDLLMTMSYFMLGLATYMLFEHVNRRVSLVLLVFVLVSAAIGGVALLHQYTVVHLLGADYMAAIGTEQVAAQVMLHMDMHTSGTFIAQMLGWGPWLFPLGYLGYRSGYFPKVLGILLMVVCFFHVSDALVYFTVPEMQYITSALLGVAAVTEFATCGWLLVKGVRAQAF